MKKPVLLLFIVFSVMRVDAHLIHPYSISWVNADLQDTKITLAIKMNSEDLLYFHKMTIDSLFSINSESLKTAATNHSEIIYSNIYIENQNGIRLPGKVTHHNFSSLSEKDNYDVMELMNYPLFFYIEIELTEDTELLIFNQTLGQHGVPSVSTLTISKNSNLLLNNVQISADKPFTMGRDVVSLGATSTENFMLSYIKLSDTQVSHELTIPFSVLNSFIELNETESEVNFKKIKAFVSSNSNVHINGAILEPQVDALTIQNGVDDVLGSNTLIYIRINYSLKSLPKNIAITWKSFNWQLRWFGSLINDFGKESEHTFSRFNPTFKTIRKVDESIEK